MDLTEHQLRRRRPHRNHHPRPARPAQRHRRCDARRDRRRRRRAEDDDGVHVIVVTGAGQSVLCGVRPQGVRRGRRHQPGVQEMPWDPTVDMRWMGQNTQRLHESVALPTSRPSPRCAAIAVAGGSDIALVCDLVVMADDAKIGYPPARVWGCPTTAMWVYRVGAEQAKRMLLTGDLIDGSRSGRDGSRARGGTRSRSRRSSGPAREAHGRRAAQPAADAEADDQPGLRQHGHAARRSWSPPSSTASPATRPRACGSSSSPKT